MPFPQPLHFNLTGQLATANGPLQIRWQAQLPSQGCVVISGKPVSALDSKLRRRMIDFIGQQQAACGFSLIVVSHDPQELQQFRQQFRPLYWQINAGNLQTAPDFRPLCEHQWADASARPVQYC